MQSNPLFFIKESNIPGAGEGLFTHALIPKGQIIIVSFRKNGNRTGMFETDYDQTETNSKVNHSGKPNLISRWSKGFRTMYKIALKDIHPGEELTSNYAHTMQLIKPLGYQLTVDFLWFKRPALSGFSLNLL